MDKLIKLSIDKSMWKVCKLGDIASEVSVRVDNPAKSKYDRFVGLEHFESGELKIRQWGTTNSITSSAKAFQKGDVLFARRNAYLRRASIVEFDGCCSGDAFVLREAHEMLVTGFLAFIVNSSELWDFANSNAAGTMSKRVKWSDLANYEIALPPKDQQFQLCELFWAINQVVENDLNLKLKTLNLFESSRNAIFSSNNSDHYLSVLRDRDFNNTSFAQILDVKMLNGIYKSKEFQGEGVRIINMGELFAYSIIRDAEMSLISLTDKEKQQFLVNEGDLIFARRSIVVEGAGQCSIVGRHLTPMTFESSMIRVRLDSNKVNSKFIYHFLKSNEGRKRMRRIVGFTTIAGITGSDLAKVKVPVISINKQNKILDYLDQFDSLFASLDFKISSSKLIQKSLINYIF